jgi:hypothetical protein
MQSGARIVFQPLHQKLLREQWESDKVEPFLRAMIIITSLMYHEQGASKLQIIRLLGNSDSELSNKDTPHVYGRAADLSVHNLVDPRVSLEARKAFRNPRSLFIVNRLNSLFPSGSSRQSAMYNQDHIHIEIPSNPGNRNLMTLSSWFEDGCDGTPKYYGRKFKP